MHRTALPVALATIAALTAPAVAAARPVTPVDPAQAPTSALTGGTARLESAQRAREAVDRLRQRSGAGTSAVVEPLEEVPFSPFLYASRDDSSVLLRVAPDGASATASPSGVRTDWAAGPAGDALAYRDIPSQGVTRVSPNVSGATPVDHPGADAAAAWAPAGDGFVQEIGGALVAQSTNPAFSAPLEVEGATGAAVSPYGTEVFVRQATDDGSTLLVGPAPFVGFSGTETWEDLGLAEYAPGEPAVGQEPGAGVFAGDERTYLAFAGTDPDDAAPHLYVDHQDDPDTWAYVDPVPVADTGDVCVTVAPEFSPNRRLLAYVKAVGPEDDPCSATEVRVVSVGDDDRYDAEDSDNLLLAAGEEPVTSLSWRASNPDASSERIGGADRYEVSVETALGFFGEASADAVVLAGGRAYADALTGGPLAAAGFGPTLLTPPSALREDTFFAIDTLLAPGGTVYVVGGTASVSARTVRLLRNAGFTVKRLGGADRYEVAVAVAEELDRLRGDLPTTAFVSSGRAFADALVAGPAAHLADGPVLLSRGGTLPAVTAEYLDSLDPQTQIFAVGGAGAASVLTNDAYEGRTTYLGGATRYDVAGSVADAFFGGSYTLALADGRNWPDAVSAGPVMAGWGQPVLLTNGRATLPAATQRVALRNRASLDYVFAFGGTASVPDAALAAGRAAAGDQTTYYGPDLP